MHRHEFGRTVYSVPLLTTINKIRANDAPPVRHTYVYRLQTPERTYEFNQKFDRCATALAFPRSEASGIDGSLRFAAKADPKRSDPKADSVSNERILSENRVSAVHVCPGVVDIRDQSVGETRPRDETVERVARIFPDCTTTVFAVSVAMSIGANLSTYAHTDATQHAVHAAEAVMQSCASCLVQFRHSLCPASNTKRGNECRARKLIRFAPETDTLSCPFVCLSVSSPKYLVHPVPPIDAISGPDGRPSYEERSLRVTEDAHGYIRRRFFATSRERRDKIRGRVSRIKVTEIATRLEIEQCHEPVG